MFERKSVMMDMMMRMAVMCMSRHAQTKITT